MRARVAVEAGRSVGWYKYVGLDGECCCIDTFGMSAPANIMFEICGFNTDTVIKLAKKTIKNCAKAEALIGAAKENDQ